MKNTTLIVGILIILGGLLFWSWSVSRTPVENQDGLVAKNGLHWHPKLIIYVDDKKMEIPANIGLTGGHDPIHTHVEDVAQDILHFEFDGVVRTEDLMLQNFFTSWGNKDIATAFGTLQRMTVNGEENTAWGAYVVRENDEIKLFYKSSATE